MFFRILKWASMWRLDIFGGKAGGNVANLLLEDGMNLLLEDDQSALLTESI